MGGLLKTPNPQFPILLDAQRPLANYIYIYMRFEGDQTHSSINGHMTVEGEGGV